MASSLRSRIYKPTSSDYDSILVLGDDKVRRMSRGKLILYGCGLFVFGLVIGVLAGYFGRQIPDGLYLKGVSEKIITEADSRISDALLEQIDSQQIRSYLQYLTKHPNLAGTDADLEKAEWMKQEWIKQGLDRVDIIGYDVLLSYPNESDPNIISVINTDGGTVFQSQREEKILRPEDVNPEDKVVPPFNAYSPPGDVESVKLYYVNYGLEEDFHWLKTNRSINFTDSIVIARYGKAFRANKVALAAQYGAKACLFYSDPFDFASPSTSDAYPDSWWLPGTGVQRGTVKLSDGDPLTPLYPSLKSAYREDPDTSPDLPKIPAHPISANDAKEIMSLLAGDDAPEKWKGSIKGLTYKIGGSFKTAGTKIKAHITTHHMMRRTYNVIGYIEGAAEPDRYVVVGNHRDGWVYGSLDPLSGTAGMLETSRALLSIMKSHSWRPRRTIVFCSWAAEEYGLVGSVEFAEHFAKVLSQRTVAYLNVDILLEGLDTIRFKGSPMLHPVIYKAAKKIPNPNATEVKAGRLTLYDTWLHVMPSKTDPNLPTMFLVGSGSDYTSFLQVLGIPSLEPRMTFDRKKWPLSSYPTYHSVYETFYLVDHVMDPGFKYCRAVTQVWAELVRDVSDSLILPLSANSFANFMKTESQKIVDTYGQLMRRNNLTKDVEYFTEAVDQFMIDANGLTDSVNSLNLYNPLAIREYNDKLMNLHRSFVDPQGLPGRPFIKNLFSAPSQFDSYAGSVFPSITDALHRIEEDEDQRTRWDKVKRYMSIVTYAIQTTAATLRKSTEFSKLPSQNV